MRSYIIRLLKWALSKVDKTGYLYIPVERPYTVRTQELMEAFEDEKQSGEWKCHQVFSRLIKEFPTAELGDLRLEIELVHYLYFRN